MFANLSRLFQRFCDRHFTIYLPGFPIVGCDGDILGYVEKMCVGHKGVRVEGWCRADAVSLAPPGGFEWSAPTISRADVALALHLPTANYTGFDLSCFGSPKGLVFGVRSGETLFRFALPEASLRIKAKAQVHIRWAFVSALLKTVPTAIKALFRAPQSMRAQLKLAMGLGAESIGHVLDPSMLGTAEGLEKSEKITIVMPVFNAFDLLRVSLQRVSDNTDLPWRMILVNDASTDPRVRPFLREWQREQRALGRDVDLIENDENVGFVSSVNAALAIALSFDHHVALLNSDAFVPANWARRLFAPLFADAGIASVTPLSNDAEIFSVPAICARTPIEVSDVDVIDAALGRHISVQAFADAPTGVGFCMAISARYLKRLPEFDQIFGRGYGEEVDWCQRAARLGGRNLCQPSVFVGHVGGASFGASEKSEAVRRSGQIISKRYPGFDKQVQDFIRDDPLSTARVLAAAAWLDGGAGPVPIYVAHSMGGGAELYLQDRVKDDIQAGRGAMVLRLGGDKRWQVEVHSEVGCTCGKTDDVALVDLMIRQIGRKRITYSCAVGDRDPVAIPEILLGFLTAQDRLDVLVHDYFMISPSYTLLNTQGRFGGVPDVSTPDTVHTSLRPSGGSVGQAEWRLAWSGLLERADEIVCFSESSVRIVGEAFSGLEDKLVLQPHSVVDVDAVQPPLGPGAIGVLGNIGFHKGADVLSGLSWTLQERARPGLIVVGSVDPAFSLAPGSVSTGHYERDDIARLAERFGVGCWIIPSIWPETFSYTVHEVLQTGLPVFCFDLGAQAEAVRRSGNGYVLPLRMIDRPAEILDIIDKVLDHGSTHSGRTGRFEGRRNRGFAAR